MFSTDFKRNLNFENRCQKSLHLLKKYPERIPVIVQPGQNTEFKLKRKKYLVPRDLTLGQFQYVIRKALPSLTSEKALFFYLQNNSFPSASQLCSQLYQDDVSDDGFLYIYFTEENTFG